MPKRSNEFQKLVYLVRVNLAEGATITESAMLQDLLTGKKREVDVCVEGTVGGQQVRVCIECRAHARPADVTWVEQIKAKHDHLPTHALILASETGFTSEAHEIARRYGIETISLQHVEAVSFKPILSSIGSLWSKTVTVSVKKVLVRVIATPTLAAENVAVSHDNLVYTQDGREIGQVGTLVQLLMNTPDAPRYLLTKGKEEHVGFMFRWQPVRYKDGNPLFLKKLDPPILREIEYIEVTGPCEIKINEFRMRQAHLGEVQLTWGKTEISGRETLVVATRDRSGIEKIAINVAEPTKKVKKSSPHKRLRGKSKS
jgi:hypothetical protein